jgi:hypothetical protein
MTSHHTTARRRVVATAVVTLGLAAGSAGHAAAMPNTIGGGDAQAVPPILPVPSAADRRAVLRAEAEKSDRWAYELPRSARYSSVELDLFAVEGI